MLQTEKRKLDILQQLLEEMGSVAVAFSGGVDSTFLLEAARMALGKQVIAITAVSALFSECETVEARTFAASRDIRQILYEFDAFAIEGFAHNPENRCYLCKKNLFSNFSRIAAEQGIKNLAEGSNIDDDNDYRPGRLAVKEIGALSPLRDAGLTKAEIRLLSRQMALPTYNKPSLACLASRFPYGETITREKLKAVETSEQLLFNLGFKQVRVRHHGTLARLELNSYEMQKLLSPELRQEIYSKIIKTGFTYVTLDIRGYRTGSMNETIVQKKNINFF